MADISEQGSEVISESGSVPAHDQRASVAESTVRFDDMTTRTSTTLGDFVREIRATSTGDVHAALEEAERAARQGYWVGGFVAYEAAPAFDEALTVHPRHLAVAPLAWFGVFAHSEIRPYQSRRTTPPDSAPRWEITTSEAEYCRNVEYIRDCIRRGEVYQVNLTTRVNTSARVDHEDLYHQLLENQQPAYGSLITSEDFSIVSASPELFFDWRRDELRCRPMKGTQRRGRYAQEDGELAAALLASPKEQAENIMIVDLVRNDMAKVAVLGSVEVHSLLELETYPQVFQLVSEVRCRTTTETSLFDVFAALFPSGSVTGAPKPSAMRIIAAREETPRGVYCGALGLLAPRGGEVHATFNVAIRTAVTGAAGGEFGTGGGVVIDSQPSAEYAEMLLKSRQLRSYDDYRLLETFRHTPGGSVEVRERHLRRLVNSARRLGFVVPSGLSDTVAHELDGASSASRVRVLVNRGGAVTIEVTRAPEPCDDPVVLGVDREPVDSTEEMLFHKTTRREHYERRRQRWRDVDDVVMINERGECTEVTTANLAIRRGDLWFTPPLSSGCLPGIAREMALERDDVSEATILPEDLLVADEIVVINSLRGWRRAVVRRPPESRR